MCGNEEKMNKSTENVNTESKNIKKSGMATKTLAMIALMTAVTCVLAPLSVPIGVVPISLTNFAIYLSVYLLGWKKGTVSYLIYLLIGIVGLPVFSGFSGGLGKLVGPTGGYLIGFILIAVIAGMFIEKFPKQKPVQITLCFVGMILGTAVCYLFGTVWFVQIYAGTETPYTYSAALSACVFPFIPGDLAKMVIAAILGPQLRKALHSAGIL